MHIQKKIIYLSDHQSLNELREITLRWEWISERYSNKEGLKKALMICIEGALKEREDLAHLFFTSKGISIAEKLKDAENLQFLRETVKYSECIPRSIKEKMIPEELQDYFSNEKS